MAADVTHACGKDTVDLTDSKVAKLKPAEKNYQVWDGQCSSFGIEVTPAGTKRWVVVAYLTINGVQRRQWHTIGQWPAKNVETARLEAMNLKDQVRKGEDPKAVIMAKRSAVRMGELIDRYYKEHLELEVTKQGDRFRVVRIGKNATGIPETGNHKEPVRSIEKSIRPALGDLPVKDIGPVVISDLLFKLKKKNPIMANRIRTMLMGLFKFAEKQQLRPIGSNPVCVTEPNAENSRSRRLSGKEIARLGAVIRANEHLEDTPRKKGSPFKEDPFALATIRLALLAGMRKSEILELRWDWVHLDDCEIRIPKEFHKTGKKTKADRIVRLCLAARVVISSLPRVLGNPFVIVGELPGTHRVGIDKPWHRIREAAGLAKEGEPDDEDVTVHDLRRTFSSVGADMGIPELFLGALLGHSVATVTQRYARVSQHPLYGTVEEIGARIAGLLDGSIQPETEAREQRGNKSAATPT